MKDKLYRELNRSKPDKSVLDAAKEEMRAAKRPKRAYLKPVLGACCSIVLIAVVIVALVNPYSGINGCTSSDKDAQYTESPDKDDSSAPDAPGSVTEIILQAPFYETEDGVFEDGSVTVSVLPPVSEYAYDGEITIGEYSLRARYSATADGYEVYAEEFMLKIAGEGITFERLGEILDLVIIL